MIQIQAPKCSRRALRINQIFFFKSSSSFEVKTVVFRFFRKTIKVCFEIWFWIFWSRNLWEKYTIIDIPVTIEFTCEQIEHSKPKPPAIPTSPIHNRFAPKLSLFAANLSVQLPRQLYTKLKTPFHLKNHLEPRRRDRTVSRTEPTTELARLWTPFRMTIES